MGDMHQVLNINGATNLLRPNGSTTVLKGGLLALRSNIGSHERDELAFVPEVGVNIGLHLTRRLKARVGYSFLWVSSCRLQMITSFHKYSEQIDLGAHRQIADRKISQLICR